MSDNFFEEIKEELHNGAQGKGHPFRFFALATLGVDHYARLRTIALRKVSEDLKLTFFTDKRSKKIIHIKENKRVSLLFYHPEKLLQVRVQGFATINRDREYIEKTKSELGRGPRKNYTTKDAPGSILENPAAVDYLKGGDYFSIVEIEPHRIEYLKLGQPDHTRIRFTRRGSDWHGEFLVP